MPKRYIVEDHIGLKAVGLERRLNELATMGGRIVAVSQAIADTTRIIYEQIDAPIYDKVPGLRPPPSGRWTPEAKAAIAGLIHNEMLDEHLAVACFDVSFEELNLWNTDFQKYGWRGLKAAGIPERRAGGQTDG